MIYTKEQCATISLQYTTRNQLHLNNKDVYNTIMQNKWGNELFSHMKFHIQKPANYWSYEMCKSTALLYNKRDNLKREYLGCYTRIMRNKWYELLDHMELGGNKFKRLIYAYIFSDNYVYIGLTCNINRRDKQHVDKDINSPVYKHIQSTGLQPTKELLTDYIDVKESVKMEKYYIKYYKNLGYKLLNSNKSGQLGGVTVKWDYENTKKIALSCNNTTDFRKNYSGAYTAAVKNCWLDEFFPNRKTIKKLSENDYAQIENIALSCKNVNEFHKNHRKFYDFSVKNNWINKFFPNKITCIKWTVELIKHVIKENNYKYLKDFKKDYSGGYKAAKKFGILDELFPEKHPNYNSRQIWSLDEIKKLIKDKRYNRRTFAKKSAGAYRTAKENNWLDVLLPIKNKKDL